MADDAERRSGAGSGAKSGRDRDRDTVILTRLKDGSLKLYELAGMESLGPQRDPWAKLGGQLATGSGKTKMMSLLIAWSHLNALCEPGSPLGLGRQAILIAPGLFVRDRLLLDFFPPHGATSVFFADPANSEG